MIGVIIQARMSSTRLPGKVMKTIENKTILNHIVEQLSNSKVLKKIVIATSKNTDDDIIESHSHELGVACFRGDLSNVLERHYLCAKQFSFDPIVRIPSDKPLIDPVVVDEVIEKFYKTESDYISNFIYPLKYNIGTEVEVFSFNALEKASKLARKSFEKEHIFPFFHHNKNIFKINFVSNLNDISHLRFPLDRKEDLKLINVIFSNIKKRPILKQDILNLYNQNPNLFSINKKIDPNEGQIRSLKNEMSRYYK